MLLRSSSYQPDSITVSRALAAWLLLLLYLVGMVAGPLTHQTDHGHEHVALHTPEHEEDPCHRAVYHQDVAEGCAHDTHLNPEEDSCVLCHFIVSNNYFSPFATSVDALALSDSTVLLYLAPLLTRSSKSENNRGPPVLA